MGGEQMYRRLTVAAVLSIAALALAACGSAATSTPPSQHSVAPAATTSVAEPDTATGAQAAAQTTFELYSAHQYGAVYALMVPSFQQSVSEATYVAVHEQCGPQDGLSYTITNPVLASPTSAVVQVGLAGVASSLGSETMSFSYINGKWLWAPSAQMLQPYQAGSTTAIVAAMKAQSECS